MLRRRRKKTAGPLSLWLERSPAKHGRLVNSQLSHTKDFYNGICCFSCFNAQHLRVAQKIKKQSVVYTSVKNVLIYS